MPAPTDRYGAIVYADTPTAYWRFDGDATDVMGGTSATLFGSAGYGTRLVSAYTAAQSLSLGTSDYATVPDAAQFDYTTALSIETWVKVNAFGVADDGIVGKVGWGLGTVAASSTLRMYILGPNDFCPYGPVSAGVAYHLVGTFDNVTMRLYLNGVQVNAVGRTGSAPVNADAVEFGSYALSPGFDGVLDEIAVYGRALTATEVAKHYANGAELPILAMPPRRP